MMVELGEVQNDEVHAMKLVRMMKFRMMKFRMMGMSAMTMVKFRMRLSCSLSAVVHWAIASRRKAGKEGKGGLLKDFYKTFLRISIGFSIGPMIPIRCPEDFYRIF